MAKYCIIGNGYLAKHLKEKIGEYSWYPTEDTEYIFYLSGCTHLDFAKNPDYFARKEIDDIYRLANHKAKLIYPSSALVYEANTKFTKTKEMCEWKVLKEGGIVLRIYPVYGREYKTFIGQTIELMKRDKRPTIYGDGTQTRDFIFIDDVIDQMLYFANKDSGTYEVGTGILTAFNSIVHLINKQLKKNIEPIYIDAPSDYTKEGVKCKEPLSTNTSVAEAIKILCEA